MATAANSATTNHSPRYSGDGLNSPQSRRMARGVSSPWTQIVRGESEAIAAASAAPSSPSSSSTSAALQEQVPTSSDRSPVKASSSYSSPSSSCSPGDSAADALAESSDSNAGKKPAWSKPSNGAAEVSTVMGADSWPALSESARASPKSSSDSLKTLADGSLSVSQGTGIASSSSQKQQVSNNANPNATPNHALPVRQKSMKRGGGSGSVSANGGFSQPPLPISPTPVVETPPNNPSPREHTHRSTIPESGPRGGNVSQSHTGNDHPQQRNSFRRGSGGPHPRGDGSYHHNYGGRRDQDRGNHDWNHHRSFNGRDAHMQPQRVVPRGFIRPPPHSSTPFISPQPVRPFGNPMGFPELASPVLYVPAPSPESLRAMPFVAPIPHHHAVFFPAPDLQLHSRIVNQIDYYFSNENLIKDTYLRQCMDDQGWVPIKLIASFNKVSHLTDNIQLILDALRTSTVVEVQGDKVRKRNDWMKWIMSPSVNFPTVSGLQSLGRSSHDMLSARLQSVGLEEKTTNYSSARGQADVHGEAFLNRSSSGDLNSLSESSGFEGTGGVTVQAGFDRSMSARNSSKRESC